MIRLLSSLFVGHCIQTIRSNGFTSERSDNFFNYLTTWKLSECETRIIY